MFKTHLTAHTNLFHHLDGLSVAYINHEGTELPLKNLKDFEEAIKSAKFMGRDHLDLIFYDEKLNTNDATSANDNKTAIIGRFSKDQTVVIPSKCTIANDHCNCNGDPLPDWFKQYMKKFKKELLKDLKSSITDIVHEEFEKEKKQTEAKQFTSFSEKNESLSPAKLKKKKKISDKDTNDLLEKREMKLLKKIEKLHAAKFDKLIYPVLYLEKLENKAKTLVEERRKLLERGRQSNPRDGKKSWAPQKKHMKMEKSILFSEDGAFMSLQPGQEFSFSVNILNNGTVPWVSPHMECLGAPEFELNERSIYIPRLEPGQSFDVTLKGRVSQRVGSFYLAYKLFDGAEESEFLYSCFAVVSDSKEVTDPEQNKLSPSEGLVGTLIAFEKDVIANSEKKIKENIIEIERRLQDIDLLRPCTNGDQSRVGKLTDSSEEFRAIGCDLLQGEERIWKDRLEQEMLFGVDPLKKNADAEKKPKDSSNESKNFDETNTKELESDSDSELSVIFISEEDENFIVVPSFGSSSIEGDNSEGIEISKETNQKPNEAIVEEHPVKVELREEIGSEEVSTAEDCLPNQEANTKKTKDKAPKETKSSDFMKATSSEKVSFQISGDVDACSESARFKVMSNGSPVFSYSAGDVRNTKTGEGKNYDERASNFVFSTNREFTQQNKRKNIKDQSNKNILKCDNLGRPIYAVRNDGYCLPIKDLIEHNTQEIPNTSRSTREVREETQNGVNEDPKVHHIANATENSTVNIFPNVLMNSASSVASMAFNTAKSVINNLHSALKPEHGFPPREVRKYQNNAELLNSFKYIDAMITLHEMGFMNNDLNFRLLKKHDSNVNKVVNEILEMMETSPNIE